MYQESIVKSQKQLQEQLIKNSENLAYEYLKKRNYVILQKIGHGCYTETFTAFQANNNQIVVIKVLIDMNNKEYIDAFTKEKNLLKTIKNNKYSLQIIDDLEDKNLDFAAIVVEHCDCDLAQVLDLNNLTFEQLVALTFQLLNGLLVFQLNGIINGGLKPQNILYSKQKNLFILADFRQSQISSQNQKQSSGNDQYFYGDQCYRSPEVLNQQKPPYTFKKADVFSIGQLLVEVFLQRKLSVNESMNLKQKSLFEAIPDLKNYQNNTFINDILINMANPNQDQRLEPFELLQNMQKFTVNESSLKNLKLNKNEGENIPYETSKATNKNNVIIPISVNLNRTNFEESYNYQDNSQQQQQLSLIQNNNQIQKNPQPNSFQVVSKELKRKSFGKFQKITEKKILNDCQEVELKYRSVFDEYDIFCCCSYPVKISDVTKALKIISNNHNIISLILNLQSNQINEEGAKAIGISLEECHNISLLNLILKINNIGDQGLKNICLSLQNCRNITSLNLDLAYNGIHEDGINYFGQSLQNFYSITNLSLNLENNNFSAEGVKILGTHLEQQQNISFLDLNLGGIKINDLGATYLGNSLQKCQNIVSLSLNLFNNNIGERGVKAIGTSLEQCQNISSLNLKLDWNKIGVEGVTCIGTSLEKCQNIQSLNLSLNMCTIGTNGGNIIATSLQKCQYITSLTLSVKDNSIDLIGMNQIRQKITQKCLRLKSFLLIGDEN
ncbi:kinase domain protein (macronuclear) [Tetrahymena thermophila SB210]|uniref:Kinase domain protein n=1 Tax=Tetrahymena thermophila (strain SB210) TaxID=312017 RepID=Q23R79_TETTS|nr:kinase domain protein [Tetrahymena thermophila SB210]EAR99169.2 kinase domain protein [Tetrahymena thermophila SB210]|eukprot:XP_001019414.2 kinase domain protein [Tetrahymena thermophila SB210]